MTTKSQPIIVIKRKGGHGGHHGGAWKVAYADFVTAMMSLFIVLWLMGSSEKVKHAVAGYFNDPKGTGAQLGTTMTGTGATVSQVVNDDLQKLKDKLEQEIKERKELEKLSKQIEITITPEGLRIELIEDKNGTFFQSGSAQLSPTGQELVTMLAGQLKPLPNQLLLEGHTDAQPYSESATYTNWELSADRANAARRLLQQDGVTSGRISQVRGYADQMLRVKNNPLDPTNRRISLIVQWVPAPEPPPGEAAKGKSEEAEPAKPGNGKPGGDSKAGSDGKSAAEAHPPPAKPAAGAPATSKPGFLDGLKKMMPGSKAAAK
jgi:chemotaxis protein MotB